MRTGTDMLLATGLGDLRGAALGLVTGPSGVTADLVPTAVALRRLAGTHLVALFGAEHGLRGVAAAGEHVASSQDPATGLPVHSLYGEERAPTDAMLAGLDALIVDLQDVGLRYYTYPSTVRAVLGAAARRNLPVLVLDRPNPLGGVLVEGPLLLPAFRSFVGASEVPIRHGLTIGELARWMNEREGLGADLRVVPMEGWRRAMWHDETGLPWVPPSPNIPTADTCLLYGATCLLEGTTVSEGRGTAQPFALLGAPWIDADLLADRLNTLNLPGVRFRPAWFRPTASKHTGAICGGVQLHVTERAAFLPIRAGLHLLATLRALYPEETAWTDVADRPFLDLLLGSDAPRLAIEGGESVEDIAASWEADCAAFVQARRGILLYAEEGRSTRRHGEDHGARCKAKHMMIERTEQINPRTTEIDTLSTAEILRLINDEDATVPAAVAEVLPAIEAVVERVVAAFRAGGRLVYVGAGTSGRLAMLDAAECPPTYGTDPAQVQALLAGGPAAMTNSIEGAEDDAEQGGSEVTALAVGGRDVVIGIAASGRTPYVVGALRQARVLGACTVALVGDPDGPVAREAELLIAPRTGPEVVAGSTRMKAGTAQKLILNMISTAAMIRTGHTYGNLMVDMQALNSKLRARARGIVAQATGVSDEEAADALSAADGEMKTAIVMLLTGLDAAQARARLATAQGVVRAALQ